MEDKKFFGFLLAPKQLVEEKQKIRFMYREEPTHLHDSGWRLFSGDETDEFVNNPDNIGIYDIDTIIGIDQDVTPYLDEPYGSAYERQNDSNVFLPAKDFLIKK